uniref:Uncharacterized protein n=1 Tax=Cacopsylla melanoneura TaxID=428564 RepID=A0A8D8YX26_9HEMI
MTNDLLRVFCYYSSSFTYFLLFSPSYLSSFSDPLPPPPPPPLLPSLFLILLLIILRLSIVHLSSSSSSFTCFPVPLPFSSPSPFNLFSSFFFPPSRSDHFLHQQTSF